MKKILKFLVIFIIMIAFFVLTTVVCTSCDGGRNNSSNPDNIPFFDQCDVIDNVKGTKKVVSINELRLPKSLYSIEKFEFEGHEYIRFKFNTGNSNNAGIVHNPECKKCK